jgi:RNA polymerase sigma factor (sigma-70 family)
MRRILDEHEQSPSQRMITAELIASIHAAVDALPRQCKMVFKLVREDGLRYAELARILNTSVDTVDAQMVIAVRRIREKVRAHLDFGNRIARKKIGN